MHFKDLLITWYTHSAVTARLSSLLSSIRTSLASSPARGKGSTHTDSVLYHPRQGRKGSSTSGHLPANHLPSYQLSRKKEFFYLWLTATGKKLCFLIGIIGPAEYLDMLGWMKPHGPEKEMHHLLVPDVNYFDMRLRTTNLSAERLVKHFHGFIITQIVSVHSSISLDICEGMFINHLRWDFGILGLGGHWTCWTFGCKHLNFNDWYRSI